MQKINDILPSMNYGDDSIRRTMANNVYLDMRFGNASYIPQCLVNSLGSDGMNPSEHPRSESLLELDLFLQKMCNAACPECYCGDASSEGELDLAQTKDLVNQAEQLGARVVYTAGAGEPTIDPKFLDLAGYITSLKMKWIVFTNGIVFCNDEQARRFTGMGAEEFCDRVSGFDITIVYKLWSSSRKTDMLTRTQGRYSYEPTTIRSRNGNKKDIHVPCGIGRLKRAGLYPGRLAIQTLCKSDTFGDVYENIIPFAEQNGLPLILEPPILLGGAKDRTDMTLSKEQNDSISEYLTDFGCRNIYSVVVDNRGFIQTGIGEVNLAEPDSRRRLTGNGAPKMFTLVHTDCELVRNRYRKLPDCF